MIDKNSTEKALVEENLKLKKIIAEKTEELNKSKKSLDKFAYVASHDLKEPLRMITSYLQLLEERTSKKLSAEDKEFLFYALDGAKRMNLLLEGVLAFSRVRSRPGPLTLVDLNQVISQVLDKLKDLISQKQPLIEIAQLPTIVCDEQQMYQLWEHLLSNALKFNNRERPEIHISLREEANEWQFSVQDNGIGIEGKNHELIFDMFSRLHSRKHYPGQGVGLAVIKQIIERHEGKIWLSSQLDEGTTFFFTIPKLQTPKDQKRESFSDVIEGFIH